MRIEAMADEPASASKKAPEKDSTKPKASEDAAEDQAEDPFFRSDVDDLLTGEIDSADQNLLDQATTSEDILDTAGTLSKTSELPVDIEDILQETERIVNVDNAQKAPSVATSGRKTGLRSKSSQKPIPVSRKLAGKKQQRSAVTSPALAADDSAVPTDKKRKKEPTAADNRGAFVPKIMEGQGPSPKSGTVAAESSAPAAATVNQNLSNTIPAAADNPSQGKLPVFKPFREAGKPPKPAVQSAGPLSADRAGLFSLSEMASPATTADTITSPTALWSKNWATPSVKGGQNANQLASGAVNSRVVSTAAQPQSQRGSRVRHHSSHRRRSRDGYSSSTSSSSSDERPRYHRRRRRNSRHRERRRRSSDSVSRRCRDDEGRDYLSSKERRAGTQPLILGYPEPVALPQVGGYPQPQTYPQVPPAYPQQAPAYSPTPRFPPSYGQPPAVSYAANPLFPPGYGGPRRVDPFPFAGVRPQGIRWGPSSYAPRCGPQPVVAPPRLPEWPPWQPGPLEPSPQLGSRYNEGLIEPGAPVYVSGTDVSAPLSPPYVPPGQPVQRSASLTAAVGGRSQLTLPAGSSAPAVSPPLPTPPSQASTGAVNVRSTVSFVDLTEPQRSRPSIYEVVYSISSCCPSEEEPDLPPASSKQQILAGTAGSQPAAADVATVIGSGAGPRPSSVSQDAAAVVSVSVLGSVPTSSPSTVITSQSSLLRTSDSARSFSPPDAWRLPAPVPVLVEGVQAVPVQDSSHGWYQPLHIVSQSQGSDSGSQQPLIPVVLAPAEQELLSGALGGYPGGSDFFFDFLWDAPEEGAWRSGGSARRAYESVAGEAGQFSWSSDELRGGRPPSLDQEAAASETDAESEAEMEEAGEGIFEAEDEGAAAAGSSSMAPVAMETNLLRSMISDDDVNYRETNALESMADVRQACEEGEEANESLVEAGDYGETAEYGEAVELVPVVAPMPEEACQGEEEESPTSSGTDKGIQTPVDEGAQPNPETGIPEDVFVPAPVQPPPAQAAEEVVSPPIAELIDEKRLQADKDAEQMDKEMRDLELTTVELYPESRLVMLLALLCLIWILFLIITAAVRHNLTTTTTETTAASDRTAVSTTTEGGKTPYCPTGSSVSGSVSVPSNGSTTTTTEEPLLGIFICSTEYCKKEGEYLGSLVSQSSKKPCEDFYEHVCEGWKKSASGLRDNQPGAAVSTDTLLQKTMEGQLLDYVMNSTQAHVMPARSLYERCLNRAEADAALLEAKELFRRWGSEWPRTGTGGASTDVWMFAAKLLRFLGVPSLVGVEIGLEPRNLDATIIEVGPPKTIFFSKDLSEDRVVGLFTEAAQSAAQALSPQDAVVPKSTASDVSAVLTALAPLRLDDLGTSPLDFEVDNLGSLGRGVQVFLVALFENVAVLDGLKRIMVHRGRLVRKDLDETVDKTAPRAMFNYLGLLALVALSPFLPEKLASLRVLHSVHSIGRAETPTNEQLCIRAASLAFPGSIAKASEVVHKDVRRTVWLSQLETLFVGFVNNVTWMDNLTSLLVKYKMRNHRMARFFPAWPLEDCKPAAVSGKAKGFGAFVDAVGLRQLQELQQYGRATFKPSTGSPLGVWARYRLCLQLLQIPAGLVNGSVPSNGTVFALHLSRFAVRLYAGLAQLLYEGTLYELEIPLYFTEDAERTLDRLIDCLLSDARSLFPSGLEADRVRNALLEQVLALQLGFMAFRQLLGLRRIWRYDFQYSTLPNVTADQLFFIYYALDHCELSDAVYESHQFEAHRLLPAAVRVNAALRQSERFAQAFSCQSGTQMAAREPCRLIR